MRTIEVHGFIVKYRDGEIYVLPQDRFLEKIFKNHAHLYSVGGFEKTKGGYEARMPIFENGVVRYVYVGIYATQVAAAAAVAEFYIIGNVIQNIALAANSLLAEIESEFAEGESVEIYIEDDEIIVSGDFAAFLYEDKEKGFSIERSFRSFSDDNGVVYFKTKEEAAHAAAQIHIALKALKAMFDVMRDVYEREVEAEAFREAEIARIETETKRQEIELEDSLRDVNEKITSLLDSLEAGQLSVCIYDGPSKVPENANFEHSLEEMQYNWSGAEGEIRLSAVINNPYKDEEVERAAKRAAQEIVAQAESRIMGIAQTNEDYTRLAARIGEVKRVKDIRPKELVLILSTLIKAMRKECSIGDPDWQIRWYQACWKELAK